MSRDAIQLNALPSAPSEPAFPLAVTHAGRLAPPRRAGVVRERQRIPHDLEVSLAADPLTGGPRNP